MHGTMRVEVIGTGLRGRGIAQTCVLNVMGTIVTDHDSHSLELERRRAEESLTQAERLSVGLELGRIASGDIVIDRTFRPDPARYAGSRREPPHTASTRIRISPSPLLLRAIDAGRLGRKSGAGFFIYA
jgi:3-hydroxyacyl-CoA dehydrogenase